MASLIHPFIASITIFMLSECPAPIMLFQRISCVLALDNPKNINLKIALGYEVPDFRVTVV